MNGGIRGDRSLDRARSAVKEIFAAALKAAEPARAVRAVLKFDNDAIWIEEARIDARQGVHLVAVGKAAVAMATGALDALDGAIVSGEVITTVGHADWSLPEAIRTHEAGHPIPDERGVRATRAMLASLEAMEDDAVVLALISGGGSALLEAPREGLTLADLATTTDVLLRAGAPIDALNAVRAPLSRVKSGGLRAAAPAAIWVTLILSDVLGNDPHIIASGPTVPGQSDRDRALAIVDRYGVRARLPRSVLKALEEARADGGEITVDNDIVRVIGDNATAVEAAANMARSLGLAREIVWSARQGEASALGREFVSLIAEVSPTTDVVLGGGEATVTVRGGGRGGRNTEFALAAALELELRGDLDWAVASLGTDGQDAMTGLAGAIADNETGRRARDIGLDPEIALARNDSASVFDAVGGAVETGPTGTNVNDIYIAVRVKNVFAGDDVEGD